jgi:hypothetical protein
MMRREILNGEWKIDAAGRLMAMATHLLPSVTAAAIATKADIASVAAQMAMLFAKSGTNLKSLLF